MVSVLKVFFWNVIKIIPEKNILVVKGSVPGAKGGLVMIKETRKQ